MKTIKSVAHHLYLSIIISSFFLLQSCSDDNVNNSVDNRDSYQIKVWDYSDSHFFLDTIYKTSFLDYYNNSSSTLNPQTINLAVDEQSFEVWVQTEVSTVFYRVAGLHVDLPVLPASGYADSLKTPQQIQGVSARGLVRKLSQSEYKLNKYPGYVSLKINVPDNYFAGVAYKRTGSGEQFGTISTDSNVLPNDTLILKMVKVQNLIPSDSLAWQMKIKNLYQLPKTNVVQQGFEFDIKYLSNGVYSPMLPISGLNAYLITILGLDKYTNGRTPPPNKIFDYLTGFTIDPENGWIIFPTLRPFVSNFQDTIQGVTIDQAYWYPQIYEELKADAKTVPNANNYIFMGYISR